MTQKMISKAIRYNIYICDKVSIFEIGCFVDFRLAVLLKVFAWEEKPSQLAIQALQWSA